MNRVKAHGIDVTHDYKSKEGAIPLPATFAIELGENIGEKQNGNEVLLYSPYPFPWRKEESAHTFNRAFSKEAWAFLTENPKQTFSRFESHEGKDVLRFAKADQMRQKCIQCHNSHPQSPKTDWKLNDVRGILEVVIPLEKIKATTHNSLQLIASFLIMLTILGLALIFHTLSNAYRRTRKQKNQTDSIVKSMPGILFITDHNGTISLANESACTFFGYIETELVGKSIGSIIHDGDDGDETLFNIRGLIELGPNGLRYKP